MYRTGKEGEDGTLESTTYKGEADGERGGMGDIGGLTVGDCVMETEGEYFKREQIDLQCSVMARGATEDPFKWMFQVRSNSMVEFKHLSKGSLFTLLCK